MFDMNRIRSLITFIGMRDPYPENDEEPGPLLSFLMEAARLKKPIDEAWLLCSGGIFLERGRDLEQEARAEGLKTRFFLVDFAVKDVIDYAEIWQRLQKSLQSIQGTADPEARQWAFLLDSGTPQMKTCLFMAARSGVFSAELIQGVPARFAGGTYKAREVRLEGIPEIWAVAHEQGSVYEGADRDRGTGDPAVVSPAFAEALRKALAAAHYDDPVLILGETGTGKTMIARRIHGASRRKAAAFVEVNCSAIPEAMAESELFGHVRGAFTGADKARSGKFRAAHGGTIFLDEVGDLSLDIQAKLLKVLEDKEVTPVGSDEPLSADARLIAATNRDLESMIAAGHFRRDLYERLKVMVIRLPALRERREDIRPLAARFLDEWNRQYEEHRYLSEDALLLLEAYAWPGNVRELNNALRSAACSAATEVLGPECLSDDIRRSLRGEAQIKRGTPLPTGIDLPPEGVNLRARLLQIEWEYVSVALRRTGDNREEAAKLLGMTGHAFRKAMRERFSAFVDEGWEEGV